MSALFVTIACGHRDRAVPITPSDLAALARQPNAEVVEVRTGERTITVRPENDPQVELETKPCSTPQEEFDRYCHDITVPLAKLRADRDGTIYPGIRPADVERATLRLQNYVPPGWRPTFGIGVALVGPAFLFALDGQWLPIDELALHGGFTPAADSAAGYAGFRLRPIPSRRVRPWIGGAITGGCVHDHGRDGDSEPACFSAALARLGLDWSLSNGTVLVSPEIGTLFPIHDYLGITWRVAPWGGLTVAAMY